jgi:hypothetical protein
MLRLFGGSVLCGFHCRFGGQRCCGATGLGSGCPEIGKRQGQSGREGNSGSDFWGLRQWQFGLVAWVSERGWLGLDEGCRVERREGRRKWMRGLSDQ